MGTRWRRNDESVFHSVLNVRCSVLDVHFFLLFTDEHRTFNTEHRTSNEKTNLLVPMWYMGTRWSRNDESVFDSVLDVHL